MREGSEARGLIHSIPHFHIITRRGVIAPEYRCTKTKTGHPPRQRLNSPDHKLPVQEVAMADQANTRKPCERQDGRYARDLPIGAVVHKLMRDFAKRVAE